ncbi:universal stress protein [Roseovarius sp. S4756]|uniref:universal stress protein n=1 Tax=Roseovarius maritimus TaxID=3342637 RepID=UPI003726A602
MKNSTILIAMGQNASNGEVARKLEAIRALEARAVIMIVGELPVFPYYAIGVPAYGTSDIPISWQEEMTTYKAAMKAREDEMEGLLAQHDVSGDVTSVSCEPAMVADAVGRRAMLCDLMLVTEDLRKPDTLFRQVVYGVLFNSPIALLLNDHDAVALNAPKRIFVAWSTDLHSGRAVHLALPFLRTAESVIIGTVDPVKNEFGDGEDPGVDVARWLTHHGCNVTVQQYPSGGQTVGQCILDRAEEVGADLVVMGSYGHSRTRQAFFGGTTRTMVDQTDQAVFLAH